MGPTQEGAEGDFPACCLKSFLSPSTVPTGQVRAGQCHMAVPGTGGGRDAEGPPPKQVTRPGPGLICRMEPRALWVTCRKYKCPQPLASLGAGGDQAVRDTGLWRFKNGAGCDFPCFTFKIPKVMLSLGLVKCRGTVSRVPFLTLVTGWDGDRDPPKAQLQCWGLRDIPRLGLGPG
jgi:hypothetical protein